MKRHAAPIVMRHPKPIVPRPLVALVAACFVIIVCYTALQSVLRMDSLYSHVGPELQAQNRLVLEYLDHPFREYKAPLQFLSDAERSHMSDVRRLFAIGFLLDALAIGVVLGVVGVFAWSKMWDRFDELLSRSLRAAGWTVLALCFVIGAAALLDFGRFWLLFHAVLFPQGNWMFPADSMLITLYPAQFWEKAVIWWAGLLVSFGVVAVAVSYLMDAMRRHAAHFSEMHERTHERAHRKEKRE